MTAAAKEVSMDTAITAVLLELDDIYSLKEEQRTAQTTFLEGKENVFVLLSRSVMAV